MEWLTDAAILMGCPALVSSMTTVDWLWILHPVLAVVLVYPLLGVVVRLAWRIKQRPVSFEKVSGRDLWTSP